MYRPLFHSHTTDHGGIRDRVKVLTGYQGTLAGGGGPKRVKGQRLRYGFAWGLEELRGGREVPDPKKV